MPSPLLPSSRDALPTVVSIQTGRIAPLGPEGVASGFVKSPVAGPVRIGRLGLEGDEQADLTVHGGPDKAVYCYSFDHYCRWLDELPRHRLALVPGGFGENLTLTILDEDAVCIGDTFTLGTATLQVTQPRQPCFKLGLRFGDNSLGKHMMQTGRSGWYVRVLHEGTVRTGDTVQFTARPNPGWSVTRFNRFILSRRDDVRDLTELASLEGLAPEWRSRATEWLGRAGG